MNYDAIDVEKEVRAVDDAMARGAFRPATKRETMAVRLAALSAIVRDMQAKLDSDPELADTPPSPPVRETGAVMARA